MKKSKILKGIYLASNIARHNTYNIVYQDILDKEYNCDFGGNMLDIDLTQYDFVIATPPCNYYSRLNMNWYKSVYAWQTVSLLPLILIKLSHLDKPFIVENVINKKRMENLGIYKLCDYLKLHVVYVGRHIYITNTRIDLNVPQHKDFNSKGQRINDDGYNQGGSNVHSVIEKWLDYIHNI